MVSSALELWSIVVYGGQKERWHSLLLIPPVYNQQLYAITDSTRPAVTPPETGVTDPLHELLRKGARDPIVKAVGRS